jgi:hypothetical protein
MTAGAFHSRSSCAITSRTDQMVATGLPKFNVAHQIYLLKHQIVGNKSAPEQVLITMNLPNQNHEDKSDIAVCGMQSLKLKGLPCKEYTSANVQTPSLIICISVLQMRSKYTESKMQGHLWVLCD